MFNYNFFLFKDLPSAWLCGVRIIKLNEKECKAKVRHNWFNSNPFKSLYWVVQGMASESVSYTHLTLPTILLV